MALFYFPFPNLLPTIVVAVTLAVGPPGVGAATLESVVSIEMSKAHVAAVRAILDIPQLAAIVTGGDDSSIKVWNSTNGMLRSNWNLPTGSTITALASDPTSPGRVAAGVTDSLSHQWVEILDLNSSRVLHRWAAPATLLAYSYDGRFLASSDAGAATVWNTQDRTVFVSFRHAGGGLAFEPNSRVLTFHNSNAVLSLDLASGRIVRTVPTGVGWFLESDDAAFLFNVVGNHIATWSLNPVRLVGSS